MDVKNILQKLSELDLRNYPYDEAFGLIQQLGKRAAIISFIPEGSTILRVRANKESEVFSKVSDLSFKPKDFNTSYQRASTPNGTMFYGTILPEEVKKGQTDYRQFIGLCEVSQLLKGETITKKEEIVTIGGWRVVQKIPIFPILWHFESLPNTPFTTKLKNDFMDTLQRFPQEIIDNTTLICEFFEKEFAKEGTDNDFDYLLSAAYTEYLTSLPGSTIAGVLYPSVRTKENWGKGFNVAINPSCVNNNLRLFGVYECTVYKNGSYILCNNDKKAILEEGQNEFQLLPISDPTEHLDMLTINKYLRS